MLKLGFLLLSAFAAVSAGAAPVGVFDRVVDNTYLLALEQGSDQAKKVSALGFGGFELASGSPLSLQSWYRSSWKDSSITFMTQLHPNWGLVWGFNTGERGPKYIIDPGLTLGFYSSHQVSKDFMISLQGTMLLGNRLTEKPCTADYGDVGGIHVVNCRLAAAPIAPAETLKYLVHEGPNKYKLYVKLVWKF